MQDVLTKESRPPESGDLIAIYQCLCDETRLQIIHLLLRAERLCVCHFQNLLGKPQVHISKHLHYLKKNGLVEATKCANWMIYSLPKIRSEELQLNLKCLEECLKTHPQFAKNVKKLSLLKANAKWKEGPCH